MKISKNTLNLLSGFSTLNNSLFIKKGNVIATTNIGKENNRVIPIKSVLVRAEVEEKFPSEFGIYDLKQFLKIVDTFEESPDFEFFENYLTIGEKNNIIKYAYCAPNLILSPSSNSLKIEEVKENFILEPKILKRIKSLSGTLNHDDLFVRNAEDGKSIEIVLTTVNEGSGENINEYIVNIEKETEAEFNVKVSMKNFNLVANDKDNYNFQIAVHSGSNILVLEGLGDTKIVYYISSKR